MSRSLPVQVRKQLADRVRLGRPSPASKGTSSVETCRSCRACPRRDGRAAARVQRLPPRARSGPYGFSSRSTRQLGARTGRSPGDERIASALSSSSAIHSRPRKTSAFSISAPRSREKRREVVGLDLGRRHAQTQVRVDLEPRELLLELVGLVEERAERPSGRASRSCRDSGPARSSERSTSAGPLRSRLVGGRAEVGEGPQRMSSAPQLRAGHGRTLTQGIRSAKGEPGPGPEPVVRPRGGWPASPMSYQPPVGAVAVDRLAHVEPGDEVPRLVGRVPSFRGRRRRAVRGSRA